MLLSEVEDNLIEERVGCPLVVLVVSHRSGGDTVLRDPAVALTNIIFKGNARLGPLWYSACDGPRVEVDEVFGNASLVEPQVVELHLGAEELGVL